MTHLIAYTVVLLGLGVIGVVIWIAVPGVVEFLKTPLHPRYQRSHTPRS